MRWYEARSWCGPTLLWACSRLSQAAALSTPPLVLQLPAQEPPFLPVPEDSGACCAPGCAGRDRDNRPGEGTPSHVFNYPSDWSVKQTDKAGQHRDPGVIRTPWWILPPQRELSLSITQRTGKDPSFFWAFPAGGGGGRGRGHSGFLHRRRDLTGFSVLCNHGLICVTDSLCMVWTWDSQDLGGLSVAWRMSWSQVAIREWFWGSGISPWGADAAMETPPSGPSPACS